MQPLELLVSISQAIIAVVALAGLLRTGQWRGSLAFAAYLVTAAVFRPPVWFWPDSFWKWPYWLGTALIGAGLRYAVAGELLWRAYAHLPAGRRRARSFALLVVATTLLAALLTPRPESTDANWIYYQGSLHAAQASLGATWLLVLLLLIATWYGLPLDRLHRSIASGFVIWSALAATPETLQVLDPWLGLGRQGLQKAAYVVVLTLWAWRCWTPQQRGDLSVSAERLLYPWRVAA